MGPIPKRRKLSKDTSVSRDNDKVLVEDVTATLTTNTEHISLPTPTPSQGLVSTPTATLLTLPNELLQQILHLAIATPPPCSSNSNELRDVSTIHALVRVSSLVQANVVSAVKLHGDTSMRINVRFAVYEWVAEEGRRRGWSWERGMREGMRRVRGLGME